MFDAIKHYLAPLEAADGQSRWQAARRTPRYADGALTGTTRHWLRQLPARRRPTRLCTHFPRVANRIAWCWNDAALSAQVLEDLLVDRRGGRRGFPPGVVRELQRLREFNTHQRRESQPEGLWAVAMRVIGSD